MVGSPIRKRGSPRLRFIFGAPRLLEESEGDHCEHGVVMEAMPGSTFEVVEPEFFFHLLVCLFAGPTRFDHGNELFE